MHRSRSASAWILSLALLLSTALAAAPAQGAVEANHATASDLESIKGIGPSTAGKILAQRGIKRFQSWADFIARVPGVGERKAARMSDSGLTVNGQRYHTSKPARPAGAATPQQPPDPFPSGSVLVEWPTRRVP